MSDERGYDTKGSRKALGAMNAKLKAKIGRLERELAAYQLAQQPQSVAAGICPGCNGTGKGVDMGDCAQISCMCSGTGRITTQQPQSAEAVAFKKPSLLMDCNVRYSTSTTPQPSAGVVMPEQKPESKSYGYDLGGNYDEGYSDGWNACLDEFARLNGKGD